MVLAAAKKRPIVTGGKFHSLIQIKLTGNLTHFGNMNCTWKRNCQFGPSSGWTTL